MPVQITQINHVTLLTLERPEAANSITVAMALEIASAIDRFAADGHARVLVVTGGGERSFCAGGDVASLLEICEHEQADRAGPLGFARLDPGKPTIAAVNGHCFGGGFELSLWCDFRIAAENAQFGALNRHWGVGLIDGGTQRLPRIIGYSNAMWMITTGCRVDARQALAIGLCQEVVPEGQALSRGLEIAHAMAELPQAALVADRRGVVASTSLGLNDGLDFEAKLGREVLRNPEVVARVNDFRDDHR